MRGRSNPGAGALGATEATFRDALARADVRGELTSGADVDVLARFLTPDSKACGWSER
jgi:hypothetical protein